MTAILTAILVVAVVGILCAVMLVVAAKVFFVPVDERLPLVRECLPGAGCGACGYPGCDGYAEALVSGKTSDCTLCVPGGASCAAAIAKVMGLEAGEVAKKVAYVQCAGDCSKTQTKHDYQGVQTCQAAKQLFGGNGACTFGCIGLGDCYKVCPYDAIYNANGVAKVDPKLCVGCGACTKVCPNALIQVIDAKHVAGISCSNKEKGAVARKKCTNACIGCMKCARECPVQAITVADNLARIDYTKCTDCGHCIETCPVKCIELLNNL